MYVVGIQGIEIKAEKQYLAGTGRELCKTDGSSPAPGSEISENPTQGEYQTKTPHTLTPSKVQKMNILKAWRGVTGEGGVGGNFSPEKQQ